MKRFFIITFFSLIVFFFFLSNNVFAVGGEGEPCFPDKTCSGDLICTYPDRQYNKCQTQENINAQNPNYSGPGSAKSIFCTDGGVNTALGCIKIQTGNDLVSTILTLAIGIGGGLALALILYGVFIVTTSAGMPDKLKAGSEIITSAIIGLLFILLSIFLFKLIGYNILGIPGLI